MSEHNYQNIRVNMAMGESKAGEPRKIDWTLEVLKKNKTKHEELISWFSKEPEWPDVKLLASLLAAGRNKAVLNLKSEREGLKNLSMFLIKEIPDVPAEVVMTDEVKAELDKLPDVDNGQEVSADDSVAT